MSTSSSSSTLIASGDSQAGQQGTLPLKPYKSPYGEWTSSEIRFIFRDTNPDPMPSLVMMQMIADAYEERRRVWDFNKDRPCHKGDNPAMYGPINEVQKNVEDFLVKWRFLSGTYALEKQVLETDTPVKQKAIAPAKELTILSSSEDRRHQSKTPKPSFPKKVRSVFHKYLKIGKIPQVRTIPRRSKSKMVPATPTPRSRIILPALPRVDPGYDVKQLRQRTLRRMTRGDSSALRACSIRKRKITPAPEYKPSAEFLAELYPPPWRFIPTREPRIQHDDFKTLSWIQPQDRRSDLEPVSSSIGKKKIISNDHAKDYTSPFISLSVYLFIQLLIFALCVVGVFAGLWALSSVLLRWLQKCLLFLLGLPQPSKKDTDF